MSTTELPPGWALVSLGDVAQWGSGGTPKSSVSRYYGGEIPWVLSGDLNDEAIYATSSTITLDGLQDSSAKWVPEGAVLIAMYGATIGKLGITARPLTTNQAVAFAIPESSLIDTRFLFRYLQSQRELFRKAGKGGAQPNISQTILKAWPFPVPPLPEQRRIVEALEGHLSRLDAAVDAVRKTKARIAPLRSALTSITYGYKIPPGEAPAPLPEAAGADDGTLPDLPGDWSWKRLEDIADVVGGVTKDQKKQADPSYVEVPYLRVANVQRGRLNLSNISTIRVPEKKALQLALHPGDVLLNEGGDRDKLGRGWVWDGQIVGAIHQNHVFRARVRDEAVHPKLLSWYANNSGRWFEANGKQSVNLASISLSKIRMLPVPVPPCQEQDRIVERIEDQLSVLESASKIVQLVELRADGLRKAILTRAFAGDLVAQDPDDEPARLLVDRVLAERRADGKGTRTRQIRKRATAPAIPTQPAQTDAVTPIPPNAIQQEFEL